jgi:hypothetical protein
MTSREARRAAEAAASAAKATQADADALATRLVATSGRPRAKVRILAADATALTTSAAGYWDHHGLGAAGTLADGRTWRLECLNPWSGYHLVIPRTTPGERR